MGCGVTGHAVTRIVDVILDLSRKRFLIMLFSCRSTAGGSHGIAWGSRMHVGVPTGVFAAG